MALTKTQKQKIVDDLKEKVDKQKSIVLASIVGVKVKGLTRLRKEMKKQDCELKVAKKTLISLAFKGKKIDIDTKKLEGEVALSFGYRDEILPFKILYDFSKEDENLKILGGLIGQELLTREKAIELAQLSTREELLARLVGSIFSPISGLVNVLQGNIKGLMYALSAIKK
ncbi:MAG: 50S ribosomal protein L10 [Candidatus Nealsonbacteria bacterium CG09_land_8_20_14_0_10_42_14]|uniref:Large ribosomal subunit protein uL10 n=1 Tax=Candidatus Nealsonbacteria bacterium CG09_land_8_20_14_0_10_42_14 TaxID=1974707 RepID=A0A2H0WX19_9BACT|nr:MAG: 50S ribosomal protein L10 [Candidatus Nealsonbacteria bacterium CG09_land_8_20_14_0_10_42_14]